MKKLKVNCFYSQPHLLPESTSVLKNYFNNQVELDFFCCKEENGQQSADLNIFYDVSPTISNFPVLFIPRCTFKPDKKVLIDFPSFCRVTPFEEKLPLFQQDDPIEHNEFAKVALPRIMLNYDLLGNIFYRLSSKTEYLHETTHQNAPAPFAPQHPYIPLVEHYFLVLDKLLTAIGIKDIENYTWRGKLQKENKFFVCLTHDVDTLHKDWPIRLKKSGFLFTTIAKLLTQLKLSVTFERLKFIAHLLFANTDYNCFNSIVDLEKKYGFHSSFYIYSKTPPSTFSQAIKQRFIEPIYDLNKDKELHEIITMLIKEKMEIGLHGSTASATLSEVFQAEKASLEEFAEQKIKGGRQHWLNFLWSKTPEILSRNGLLYDTTVCFKKRSGWRADCSFPYLLFDHKKQKSLPTWEFPTVFMDMSQLFQLEGFAAEIVAENAISWLEVVKQYNGCACINFHIESFSKDYHWDAAYDKILAWIKENNGIAGSVAEAIEYLKVPSYDSPA